jgi:ATP-binding cassette, subfamily B, multidrug efflux pump
MRTLFRILRSLRPYLAQTVFMLFCLVVVIGASLVTPSIIEFVIDQGVLRQDAAVMVQAGLLVAGVGLVRAVFNFAKRYTGEWLINRTGYDFRNALYDKIQRLPFDYHDRAQTGQLMSRCTEDVTALSRFVGQAGVDLLSTILLLAGIVVLLLRQSVMLMLIGLGPLVLLSGITIYMGALLNPMFLAIDRSLGDVSSAVQENLSGVQVVRAFARELFERDKFSQPNRRLWFARVDMMKVWALFMPTMNILVMASTALILWFGGQMVMAGTLSLGELVAFNAYLILLAAPVQGLGFTVQAVGEAIAGGMRIFEVLDLPEDIQSPADPEPLPMLAGEVRFEDVSFAYRNSRPALHHLNVDARPNQVIALIGPTGSGKTSLINLIPRFYDVTSGRVLVDGHDVRQVDLKALRSQIGIVLQTSLLFSTTIRENIAFGRVGAAEEDVLAAARAARAHDFIQGLPEGYDTVVGERGVTLSGGQRQRVAIARALLMNPRILILDDATSSVDTQTEYLIQQALDTLMEGRTTFVIAQRLSTVKRADLILVLQAGSIVQRGRHDDLVQQPGPYQEIYNLQLKDQEQFQREMLFLDEAAEAAPVSHGDNTRPRAERPDVSNQTETRPLRPSILK